MILNNQFLIHISYYTYYSQLKSQETFIQNYIHIMHYTRKFISLILSAIIYVFRNNQMKTIINI